MSTIAPSPIPTPFDITAVPFIPWEPSLNTFVGLVVVLCIIWLALNYHLKRGSKWESSKDPKKFLATIKSQIKHYGSSDLKLSASRLSLGVKRILSLTEGSDVAALTPQELQHYAKTRTSLSQVAESLQSLESIIYAPDATIEQFESILESVTNSLETYLQSRSARAI